MHIPRRDWLSHSRPFPFSINAHGIATPGPDFKYNHLATILSFFLSSNLFWKKTLADNGHAYPQAYMPDAFPDTNQVKVLMKTKSTDLQVYGCYAANIYTYYYWYSTTQA